MKRKTVLIAMGLMAIAACVCVPACGKAGPNHADSESAPVTSSAAPTVTEEPGPAAAMPETTNVSLTKEEAEAIGFYGEVVDGGFVLEYCNSTEKVIVVPEEIQGAPVVRIGKNAFAAAHVELDGPIQNPYEKIILPSTVTEIDEYAFFTCINLKEIDLGTGIQVVKHAAFMNCENLETVKFPDGMKQIQGVPFAYCDALKEVYIPASVTDMEKIAWLNICPNIVIVTPAGSTAEQVAKETGLPVRNA